MADRASFTKDIVRFDARCFDNFLSGKSKIKMVKSQTEKKFRFNFINFGVYFLKNIRSHITLTPQSIMREMKCLVKMSAR